MSAVDSSDSEPEPEEKLVFKIKKSRADAIVWNNDLEMALLCSIQKNKVLIKTPKMSCVAKWTTVTNELTKHHLFKGYRCDVVTAESCRQKFKNMKTAAKKSWALEKAGENLSGLEEITPLSQLLHNILEDEFNKQNTNAASEAVKQKKDDDMANIEKEILSTGTKLKQKSKGSNGATGDENDSSESANAKRKYTNKSIQEFDEDKENEFIENN
jgi:hypothetical protein